MPAPPLPPPQRTAKPRNDDGPKRKAKSKANGAAAPLLGRDAILAADDLPSERVPVPEWGGAVLVRALPLAERGAFEAAASAEDSDNVEVLTRIVALAACDADGNRLFRLEDAAALAAKNPEPVMRVAEAAIRVNAITERDIEDLAKN